MYTNQAIIQLDIQLLYEYHLSNFIHRSFFFGKKNNKELSLKLGEFSAHVNITLGFLVKGVYTLWLMWLPAVARWQQGSHNMVISHSAKPQPYHVPSTSLHDVLFHTSTWSV